MRPRLIQTALQLLPPGQAVVVALDTPRLGPWAVWLAGIVVACRTLPIGWAGIPSPGPTGRFRITTVGLIQRLQAAFPSAGCWPLVADRGFPSAVLFAQLRQGNTGFSVRLRLSDWVTVAGVYAMGADHWETGRLIGGQWTAAARGRGRPDQPLVPGALVVSAAVATPPQPTQHPGTGRERATRAKAHAPQRAHKQSRRTKPPSTTAQRDAQTWGLFTSAPTVAQAVAEYVQRMSIEIVNWELKSGLGLGQHQVSGDEKRSENSVFTVSERDGAVREADEAVVGDSDLADRGGEGGAGGMAAVIGLTMDIPRDGPALGGDVRQQSGVAHLCFEERTVDGGEGFDGDKAVGAGGAPGRAVLGEATARHAGVEMRVVRELPAPGMPDPGETRKVRPEAMRVCGEPFEGVSRGVEQGVIREALLRADAEAELSGTVKVSRKCGPGSCFSRWWESHCWVVCC